MNLSFIPGDLHLAKRADGIFVVTMRSEEILSTKSQKSALTKFNSLRAKLETEIPRHVPTAEEKAEFLQREVGKSAVGYNSFL
jgi:hypothetical protein